MRWLFLASYLLYQVHGFTPIVDNSHLLTLQQVVGHLDVSKYAVEGAIAGGCRALARGLTFPFDTIKTLEQVDSAVPTGNVVKKEETLDVYLQGLFRGITPAVVSAVPANAAFFIVYKSLEVVTNALDPSASKLVQRLVISSLATLPQNSIKIPFENVKQKMQTSSSLTRQQVVSSIYRKQGLGGFFIGSNAMLIREIPYNALQMSIFELTRELVHAHGLFPPTASDAGLLAAAGGLFASTLAALLTQPADVVKTKIMATGDDTVQQQQHSVNILEVVKCIYAKEGWRGFFVGLKPRLALVSLGGLVYFWAAEMVEQSYEGRS